MLSRLPRDSDKGPFRGLGFRFEGLIGSCQISHQELSSCALQPCQPRRMSAPGAAGESWHSPPALIPRPSSHRVAQLADEVRLPGTSWSRFQELGQPLSHSLGRDWNNAGHAAGC